LIVFCILGMFFGRLLKNGWEEQLNTNTHTRSVLRERALRTGDRSPVTDCGEKRRGTIRLLKAGRPGWAIRAKFVVRAINNTSLMAGAIIE
jgi:hypothetical protein